MPTTSDSALDRVKRLFSSEYGRLVERFTSPHTHPGGKIWRLIAQKLRVLSVFIVRRALMGRGRRKALTDLQALGGSCKGLEVLVIGSGPSAERLNVEEVKLRQSAGTLKVIATNYFLHSPISQTLTPDYLVWADSAFNPAHHSRSAEEWQTVEARDGIVLVVPWEWRQSIEATYTSHTVIYFDNDSLEGWSRNVSPLKPRGYQGSTGVKALAVALHFEPQSTLVIGLDLSNFRHISVSDSNKIFRNPAHLEGADSGTQEITHETFTGIPDVLYSFSNQFLALHTQFAGKAVKNLDPNSLVDAFPKVNQHPLTSQAGS